MKIEVGKVYWVKNEYDYPLKMKVITIVKNWRYAKYQCQYGRYFDHDDWFDKSDFVYEVKE